MKKEKCSDCGRVWEMEENENLVQCVCTMEPLIEAREPYQK